MRDLVWVAGIFLLALLVYWPALHGALLWDDPAHVTRPDLRGWDGLWRIWFDLRATQEYYPVLHSAFWLEHRLWDGAVLPYHLVNVLLHAANGCLLAFILRRIWRQHSGGSASLPAGVAWLAAALFVVHPVGVESVAWITEQKNTLSTFLYFLAAWCYLDFSERRGWRSYALGLGLFVLALGAKTVTVTLPAALLVVRWWQQGRLDWRRDVRPLVPWLTVAIAAGLITSRLEGTFVGADLVVPTLSSIQRTLLAARIFWFSLGKLLWPAGTTFFYPLWDVATEATGWAAYLIAGLAVTALLWWYRQRARGALAAWLLYAGTLFPVLGFFKVFAFSFSYVADHFQYLAIPPVMAAVAVGLSLGYRCLSGLPRWVGPSAGAALVFALGLVSRAHSGLYRDNLMLFRANVAANPTSWMGYHILASTVGRMPGGREQAIAYFRKAMELKRDNPDSMAALGALLVEEPGHDQEALELFQRAVALRPTFAEAQNGLANQLALDPVRLPEAVEHYKTALRLRPDFHLAQANLAQALAQIPGREQEALTNFEAALRAMPDYAPAHFHLANLLARLPGRVREAIPHFEKVLRLRPTAEAQLALGDLLAQLGHMPEAISHFEAAVRLRPDVVATHLYLANVLATVPERRSEAVEQFEAALQLQPNAAEIHGSLANTLALLPGRMPEAMAQYQMALQLDPGLAWIHYDLALQLANASDLAGAEEHAKTAVQLKPDYVEALNLLGVISVQRGLTDAARDYWNRALLQRPDFEPARRNLERLKQETGG